MTIETTCPDCRGIGGYSVVDGDSYMGKAKCYLCKGFGWTEIELTDEEVHDIITQLFEQKHELISKYL